mgnify:CR=1 FL=1
MFPQVDPIPLPAPVWLFKVLEVLTTSLHFAAVQLLLGGLIVSAVWAFFGRGERRVAMRDAAGSVATRLPILMVYVINFGVPPLLFAQVLYGRAIYTSSVLIGAAWISVIFLLMLVYSLLYVMAARARRRQAWSWVALAALGVDLLRIYPQAEGTGEVIARFHAARDATVPLPALGARNGYWHGEAGMAGAGPGASPQPPSARD